MLATGLGPTLKGRRERRKNIRRIQAIRSRTSARNKLDSSNSKRNEPSLTIGSLGPRKDQPGGEDMAEGLFAMLIMVVYLVVGSVLVVALVRLARAATRYLDRH